MQRKSTKIWLLLIVGPIGLLILTILLQIIARATGVEGLTVFINLFSLLVGMFAVVGLLGLPVWITLLVLAMSHNSKVESQQS